MQHKISTNFKKVHEFADASFAELALQARKIRDAAHGNTVTYSPKVFIPLTKLCQDRCGYCTFAQPPARLESPYLDHDQVIEIARKGQEARCSEALFTLGERPENRYPSAKRWLNDNGYATTLDYLADMAKLVRDTTGLLPHINAGALHYEELEKLRKVSASVGMMIETLNDSLACHVLSVDKTSARRLETLNAAGELNIPFTTGILVGIGESRSERIEAIETIADIQRCYGHIQEVIIQNFLPKPRTSMHDWPECDKEEFLWTIAMARIILPPEVHLQAPPNLQNDIEALLDSGIDDFGGISPVTTDHVNPERPWPKLTELTARTEAHGMTLVPRLTVYPEYVTNYKRWIDDDMHFFVFDLSDAEGLAREDGWCAGQETDPPSVVALNRNKPVSNKTKVTEVLQGVNMGQEVGEDEIITLFSARGNDLHNVIEVANELRQQAVGDIVTWVSNRNINYTNICTFRCRFCAFSKGPLSLNLRGKPYLLDMEEIAQKVIQAEAAGATEVCLQGGIHPSFDGDYYLNVVSIIKEVAPKIHIHGFTALEVTEGAKRLGESLQSYLKRLYDAGLRTLPGTAAEILDDEIREVLCPDKITTDEWLEAHRIAHGVGLRSNVTIMFGSVESPKYWARHLIRTRELQSQTGGFTEFVLLPFVHMGAPIYLQRKSRRGPTFRETILMHSVGRIAYNNYISNIQTSWPKMGVLGVRQALEAGANDLGGTLMEEHISRSAGSTHGQNMSPEEFLAIVEPLGRKLCQRNTLYELINQDDSPLHNSTEHTKKCLQMT
ncbi:MAG: 5-amino-6-(D-ribitylamino)uracil--L-tyrosine 4-hydroxyphenyl transferase CofH [Actinobacteria bacterium]|nr:5-amino-6-(D-ribitylamino)uracil--L-tyrosine 4-hydroxyphenyl transferase CofH [Actinomycetota bacterium]MCL6105729.1 5-amino-6-(D-ribitylamino)uracil--L-tyrosine 4-hydroxyphenyl transferase CofH [Actinomycetota bacterium]